MRQILFEIRMIPTEKPPHILKSVIQFCEGLGRIEEKDCTFEVFIQKGKTRRRKKRKWEKATQGSEMIQGPLVFLYVLPRNHLIRHVLGPLPTPRVV